MTKLPSTDKLYIVGKRIKHRIGLIFKFCENISNNRFSEIFQGVHISLKFKYFEKQIMYLKSPDHMIKNDI